MEQPLLKTVETAPEERAGFFSRLTFWFVTPILVRGYKEPVKNEHLPPIAKRHGARTVKQAWQATWAEETSKPRPSLARALIRSFFWRFQVSVAMEVVELIFNFFGPILMQSMIIYTQQVNRAPAQGIFFAFIMLSVSLFRALAGSQVSQVVAGIGMDVQTCMITSVYDKAIKFSTSKSSYTKGEIINIQSSDALRIASTSMSMNNVWATPAQIVIAVILLLRTLGIAAFAGMIMVLAVFPFNSLVFWALASLRIELMGLTDKRVTMMNEMLGGIRVVKFTCLEDHFKDRIMDVRKKEMLLVKKQQYWHGFINIFQFVIPILVSVSTFVAYTALGGTLNAALIFTAQALFNNLRGPLGYLPMLVASFAEARASIRRVEKFLLMPSIQPDKEPAQPLYGTAVAVKDCSFVWDEAQGAALHDINLEIPEGSLTMVVGKVGSGKSSLINAILGEMEKTKESKGYVYCPGKLAYSQQQAWIVNDTVQENILFGSPYFEQEYEQVIDDCCLRQDFKQLAAGDQTEIGEQGVNLSGGQKQRISLARAQYSNADVFLLDDPLSAVDPHVGRHLFDRCICGALRESTRILVTHQLQYLDKADKIIVMDEGRIVFNGLYHELMSSNVNIAEFLKEGSPGVQEILEAPPQMEGAARSGQPESEAHEYEADEARLIAEEDRAVGAVKWESVWWYIGHCGQVLWFFLLFIGCAQFLQIATDVFLTFWSDLKFWPDPGPSFYLAVFSYLGFIASLFSMLKSLALVEAAYNCSLALHNKMLTSVLRAPISFFDSTPAGRILNRFSKDLDSLDAGIADQLAGMLSMIFVSSTTVVVIAAVMPVIVFIFVPLTSVYFWLMQYYRATSRELNRVVSISASPIYSHFAESLYGVSTIRAFKQTDKFCAKNERCLDSFHGPYWAALLVSKWLSVRLEFIGSTVLFATTSLVVLNTALPPGLVGLTMSYAQQITVILEMAVTTISTLEGEMNSVERVMAYTQDIVLEAPATIPERRPPLSWLRQGCSIDIQNLSMRYRPALPEVLKNINLRIADKEKLGIVGRTGSGKSSLMLALLRIVEAHTGRIVMDGLDISQTGLQDLRSRISIIPQDPILFSGTIKENLDPDSQHDDSRIWHVLEQCHLRDMFEATEDKLDTIVVENGGNFSVGQRQLLCLARALLRDSKLLLMDEVTASVDLETDKLIQTTVAQAFRDCTVVTIAHRLETIAGYDRVLCMSSGKIAEEGSPLELMDRKGSVFRGMCEELGAQRMSALRVVALSSVEAKRREGTIRI